MSKDFAAQWAAHHGGVQVNANLWVRGWLTLVIRPARMLAQWRVSPSLLSLIGLGFSVATVWVSIQGLSRFTLLTCSFLVIVSAYFDGLDGAVAILRDQVTRLGALLDRICDRLSELAWLSTMVFFGAPLWLGVTALLASWGYEWSRWRASVHGNLKPGAVSVAERPVRVAIVVMFLLAGAIFIGWSQWWLIAALVAWVVMCLVGVWQVSRGF